LSLITFASSRPLNNFTYTSTFFKPTLDISYIVLDYVVIENKKFSGQTDFSPNLDHVSKFDCITNYKSGITTCDDKWCAAVMYADITPPPGFTFYDIYNANSYDLTPLNSIGTGSEVANTPASWNWNMVNGWRRLENCANNPAMTFSQKANNIVNVGILTGSGPTKWSISKEAVKITEKQDYPPFVYSNYKIITVSIPSATIYNANSKTQKVFAENVCS
jgi:hypothetical protein